MKPVIALTLALLASDFVGPPIGGALGMEATPGFDGVDALSMFVAALVFFGSMWALSFVM